MMVSGNRVVADVINSAKTRSYILEKSGLLIQFSWCPHEKREIWTQKVREENRWRLRDTWGEDHHVKTDTETALTLSQAGGLYLGLSEPEEQRRDPSQSRWREHGLTVPGVQTFPPRL